MYKQTNANDTENTQLNKPKQHKLTLIWS